MNIHAEVISIQVGMPRVMADAKPWTSGFIKEPVAEPIWLGTTNLQGDGQADQAHHGGTHKAVCAYPASHYDHWRRQLHLPELRWGDFGENFTIAQVNEHDVCIGDTWMAGDAMVQISQPRQPCWKLAKRWNIKDLALQVQQTGRTGWYFRVLQEGFVHPGMELKLSHREHPHWTIAEANRIMHHDKKDHEAAAALAAIPSLSESWKITLTNRVEKGIEPDIEQRLQS
ncbi:MOSC domain-containing protein [Rhodopirellula sp. P2]|uniref:MOSC domain-containing protein n=1 Tax=Rhodopirellula sp. P2 TaxID=2127060 RepID=UPI002368F001|nr:MOSC domain-containing protein [Rhodopirellula sp. P2]WDQ15889.1 MOSC domain-containing protein [Rhodopirellula sp. P2]